MPFETIKILALATLFALPHAMVAKEQISKSERDALLKIFSSAHGESWKRTSGWVSDVTGRIGQPGTECDWFGVKCKKGHVTELDLSSIGLQGTLPEAIGSLTRLVALNVSSNRLAGQLPKSLLKLEHLEKLNLASNRFVGTFPSADSPGLPRLKLLSVSNNHLRGPIDRFAHFLNLEVLDISENQFEGHFTSAIGSLNRLWFLNASANRLTGNISPEIGNLRSLRELYLRRNSLTGAIPNLQRLVRLQTLDLSYNHLEGAIPGSLLRLNSNRELILDHNSLRGALPFIVCSTSLRRLDLSWNRLSGVLPKSLSSCAQLNTLDLSHNRLGGALASKLLNPLQNLARLNLSSNRFSGTVPPLGELSELEYLDLSTNSFSGELGKATWPELKILRLDSNKLSGKVPAQIFTKSLRELTLSNNRFIGLPTEWCDSSVRVLELSDNELSGTLCSGEEGLPEIRYFNASHNRFSGNLPAGLLDSDHLTTLILAHNRLTGSLPEKANPSVLQTLDISFNELNGKLPTWVGQIPYLVLVNIRGNNFSAGLQQLTLIKTLRKADVRENKWTEAVPVILARLQDAWAPAFPRADIDPDVLTMEQETKQLPGTVSVPEQPAAVIAQTPSQVAPAVGGDVTDPAGGVIARAKVTATSGAVTVETSTDEAGSYRMSLPPGTYRLLFSSQGFKDSTVENVTVTADASLSINITLQVGAVAETVEVSGEAEAPSGPWWNTWITHRGTSDNVAETTLESDNEYTFYLELSAAQRRNLQNGELSTSLEASLRDRLSKMLSSGVVYTAVLVRVSILGRSVGFSQKVDSSAEWYSGTWSPNAGSTSAMPMRIDLSRLFPYPYSRFGNEIDPSVALRGGGLRFGLKALKDGCSAIAISIWDDTRSVPLDHFVRLVSVGKTSQCDGQLEEKETSHKIYSAIPGMVQPDVSLQVFDFTLNGTTHSASFMAIRKPTDGCESYQWNSDAELTGLVLGSNQFGASLADARATDGVYSSIADQVARAVFPQRRKAKCGSAEAFNALIALSKNQEIRMFAYISDDRDRLLIVPLGLLTMLMSDQGDRVFAHDIRLLQPMVRETLGETDCVGNWTFVLPSALDGIVDPKFLEPPPSLATDKRVLRSRQEFESQFLDSTDDSKGPTGLVVLAHHDDGVLTFSGAGDSVVFTRFERDWGDGSIAVLSACQTANLTASTKLIDRLNDKGVDGVIVTSFPLEIHFGIRFAFNWSDVIAQNSDKTITLEEVFSKAVGQTVEDLASTTGERARGMGLELVLVGNPKLKICPSTPAHAAPQ
jgi:Leucine-rich repeat (LRR) protein